MTLFDDWRARSPFYDETHEAVAQSVRRFVEREIAPHIDAWEDARAIPRSLHRKAAEAGILGLGYPEEYGGHSAGFDVFHNLTQSEELARPGAGGLTASLMTHGIGLPPILAMGSDEMKRRVAPAVLSGEKIIALGITEASGGSDVANIRTRAERVGSRYVVNGGKMFITSGMRADYVTVAVRTGGEGMGGLSLMLIEADMPGFTRTPLEKMGWHCSDTAALYFENVEVPPENLIGPENAGFMGIMRNFNSERLGMAHGACAYARVCLEEAAAWARERETFGKSLVGHQSIRIKLADMARQVSATQAWVDQCAWQVRAGKTRPADFAMLKVQATRMLEAVARDAAQVLGGASYLKGSKVERIYREVRVNAIGGGSEEILLDLAGRQLFAGR
ncbi:acyl-CoA dehydrogenase family protein [Sphingosinicella microcystinivorans]|uniref:acyl-CoA dehydrogenase family protein n=1 Tax=Sphingosinicella microcystinivorans TaxID=335406 RepID=UPI0022F3DA03|nr:acyl-CoA dehydrogenase family protein [Sphingosinicella microcystinivorans]WBX84892.1 acyl-CoA dehydrogenase family protein [Sphingosinicella microcystinivorans]